MAREVDYIEVVAQTSGQEELKKVSGIIDELMKRAKQAGINVDDLAESLKEVKNNAKDTKPYDNIIGKMKQIVSIAAIGMGVKNSINIFSNFDDVARRVQGTTGATAETMELLRYQAKELGRTTSWSASEAAEAQFEFAKAGFNTNEIIAATGGILDIATAAQMGLAEATEITAGVLKTFKLDASKSTLVGDMLAKTASSTTTDVRDLAEAVKEAGVGSRNFGLNLQQTLGVLGKMGDEMLKGSKAGTALQAVFSTLQNQAKAEMLTSIGVQLTEDGSYRNFLEILKDIKEKTAGMEKAQRGSFLNQVFQEQGSQAINRLIEIPEDELNKLIAEIENSGGFSKRLAELLNNGLGGAFRNLQSATEGLAISFGEYLEPATITLVNGIIQLVSVGTGFIDWLNSGSYLAETLNIAIYSLVGGYIVYKGILIATTLWTNALSKATLIKTGILKASSLAMAGLSVVTGILTGATNLATISVWALNTGLSILASPIAVIVGAVVGLGIGFTMLYKKSETFRNAISPLVDGLKELWEWIKKFDFVSGAINFGKNIYQKAKDFVTAGTKGKTNQEKNDEINNIKNQVASGSGKSNVVSSSGPGINTDYLISGSGNSGTIKHNGYYLKGTKNNGSNENIYTNSSSTSNSNNIYTSTPIEKTIEEKMLDALLSIKNLLTSKGEKRNNEAINNSQIVININKGDNIENIISQVVEDLTIALGNI